MNKHQYFYIISGLPNLSIQDAHLPFPAKVFLDDLKYKIDQQDFHLLSILYYGRDSRNLLQVLFDKKAVMHFEGRYSLQELKKGIEGDFSLPRYMNDFIREFKENGTWTPEAEWETKLTEGYFKEAQETGNEFLNQWMEFELNLKNLLLGMTNRKQALPFSEFVIEANEIATLMKESPTADFSTRVSIDFIKQIEKIIEIENLIERENKIDALRWKKLEEMTFLNYFTIEAILGFTIKLMIIERWTILKHEQVNDFLPSWLDAFTEKIKMPVVEN
ncbi:DUF2764 family protein [Mucilaginibacter sp.]|uniref:DUF2764 family protein n=1 Tax=Mucilaginibacter sp. TaxID=1882438 RepID=UPI00374DB4D3